LANEPGKSFVGSAVLFEVGFREKDLGARRECLAAHRNPGKSWMAGVGHDAAGTPQSPALARISCRDWTALDDIGAQQYLGDFISDRQAELPRREFGRSRFLIQLEEPIHRTTLCCCARP
jgi:hypothetical protein